MLSHVLRSAQGPARGHYCLLPCARPCLLSSRTGSSCHPLKAFLGADGECRSHTNHACGCGGWVGGGGEHPAYRVTTTEASPRRPTCGEEGPAASTVRALAARVLCTCADGLLRPARLEAGNAASSGRTSATLLQLSADRGRRESQWGTGRAVLGRSGLWEPPHVRCGSGNPEEPTPPGTPGMAGRGRFELGCRAVIRSRLHTRPADVSWRDRTLAPLP